MKDWILGDISDNMDIGQFGGQAGTGTEHLIACLLDRVLLLLDRHPDKSAVIAASIDWAAAFDRQDPTLEIKFNGIRCKGLNNSYPNQLPRRKNNESKI